MILSRIGFFKFYLEAMQRRSPFQQGYQNFEHHRKRVCWFIVYKYSWSKGEFSRTFYVTFLVLIKIYSVACVL